MKRRDVVFLAAACAALSAAGPAAAQESVIYSTSTSANTNPAGPLLLSGGALYGAAVGGSTSSGTVFELTKGAGGWKEETIHTFAHTDGSYPAGGLIADANAVLYGATNTGGNYNSGTFYALTKVGKKWAEQTLWNFGNRQTLDGGVPVGTLLMDASGAIYGTTLVGGVHNLGTVFKLTSSGGVWTSTVLYSFAGGRDDGQSPTAGLTMDRSGVLYGTTFGGGTHKQGTVFALAPSGNTWSESVLHSFGKGADGHNPGYGALALDSKGNLYGTTPYGGANEGGVVFELAPSSGGKWKEKIIYAFGSGSDGRVPNDGVIMGKSGVLYGDTANGGQNSGGTVFQLVRSGNAWTETLSTNFPNFTGDAFSPQGGIMIDSTSGTIYGATYQGGSQGLGAVYQIVPE